jgi:hypothetical protein
VTESVGTELMRRTSKGVNHEHSIYVHFTTGTINSSTFCVILFTLYIFLFTYLGSCLVTSQFAVTFNVFIVQNIHVFWVYSSVSNFSVLNSILDVIIFCNIFLNESVPRPVCHSGLTRNLKT